MDYTKNTILVWCSFCGENFDLNKSTIKGDSKLSQNSVDTFTKIPCPHCNKKDNSFIDVKKKQAFEEAKNNPQPQQPKPVICPQCHSNQLYASEKGFSALKALGGSVVAGGIGLLAGLHGSKRLYLTCLSCGHKWKVGN